MNRIPLGEQRGAYCIPSDDGQRVYDQIHPLLREKQVATRSGFRDAEHLSEVRECQALLYRPCLSGCGQQGDRSALGGF